MRLESYQRRVFASGAHSCFLSLTDTYRILGRAPAAYDHVCDMVGSSALSTRLDPEEQGNVIAAFHTCCANEITSLGGMVAQYLGDGVLAYFGYPTAHENDAERAILAGLAILKAVPTLNPAADVVVQTRIAIGSGVVVVGDLVRQGVTQENAAIGETTNLVARLQALAEPNTIVISPVTHRLVGALFEYRDLGRHTLKGFSGPVQVRQVLASSKVESRFEAHHPAGTSPLLGRDEELALLLQWWEQAKGGEGRVVLLTGEPGIGKSRIANALRDRLSSDPHTPLSYFCSPLHQGSALYPLISQLTRAAGIERDDDALAKLKKLRSLLRQSSGNLRKDMPLFAALLSIPGGDDYTLPEMPPQRRKARTLAALLDQMKRIAARQPILMLFEDLHWIDPTSLEFLSLENEEIGDQRILLLATARPEFTLPWPNRRHVSTLTLSGLGRSDGEALIVELSKGKALPPEVRDQIIGRTDGVPLFIEELTKTVLESGLLREGADHFELTGPLPSLAIPSTLYASLLARLDRLAAVKDVAQIGAVIGREFSYPLMAAAAALSEKSLNAALGQLVDAGLIHQRGVPPDATYVFKHALVQEATYETLLRSRRRQLHARVGDLLETRHRGLAEVQPELLGHHFSEAGLPERAVRYWLAAGRICAAGCANHEAASHARCGLADLQLLPQSSQRDAEELDLRVVLGSALTAIKGYSVDETVDTWEGARRLIPHARQSDLGDAVLSGLYSAYYNRGAHRRALEVGDELLARAERARNALSISAAHRQVGATLSVLGEFRAANEHCRKGFELFDPDEYSKADYRFVNDIGVAAACQWAIACWHLGEVEQSLQLERQALARMAELKHHNTTGYGTFYAGALSAMRRRDLAALKRYALELQEHGTRHKLPQWFAFGSALEAPALAHAGKLDEALAKAEAGIGLCEKIHNRVMRPVFLSGLAEVQMMAGLFLETKKTLDTALELAEQTEERWANSELWRLRGVLALASRVATGADEAAEHFRRGIEVARRQESKMLGLRLTTSLARLVAEAGRIDEAREMLVKALKPICGGAITPDPKDARDLLGKLK